MELNDLKDIWMQYDKRLKSSLKLNEELLRLINLEKHNRALRKPLRLELLNMMIQIGMIGLTIYFVIQLSTERFYLITGAIACVMCTISLIFSATKVSRLYDLAYYHLSIMQFQKEFIQLKIFIMRLRKIEYNIASIIGITLLPLLVKATTGIDLLGHLTVLIPALVFVLGSGYSIGVWLNLIVYDKSLKDAEMFLSLLNKFSNEE
ncbi:MAG: hypothetical protein M0Q41_12050 [Bacteroidales bacterium]|nr:hypothetical protein [Bacteroidales bacterium]